MAEPTSAVPESAPESPIFGPAEPGHNDEYDTPYYEAEPAKTEPKVDAKPAADVKPAAESKADDKPADKASEKKAEPVAPKHNADMVELALDLGATEAEIESVSPAVLKSWVREQSRKGRQPAVLAKKEEESAEDEIAFEFGGSKKSLKVADLDENVAAFFKAQQAQIKQLNDTLTKQEQARDKAQRTAAWHAVEEAFEGLDATIFGKGGYAELDKNSDEFMRRDLLVRAAKIENTDTAAQITKKIKAAARLFGAVEAKPVAEPKTAAAKETPDRDPETGQFVPKDEDAAEVDRWRKGGLPGSTERESPPPRISHREHAIKNLGKELRKHGVVPNGTA